MAALAGKCQQVFMAAIFTFDSGKTVVQTSTVEITVNHLFDIWPPEPILPGVKVVINLHEGLEAVFDAAVVIRILRMTGPVNACG
jgi:hypothetical protein